MVNQAQREGHSPAKAKIKESRRATNTFNAGRQSESIIYFLSAYLVISLAFGWDSEDFEREFKSLFGATAMHCTRLVISHRTSCDCEKRDELVLVQIGRRQI